MKLSLNPLYFVLLTLISAAGLVSTPAVAAEDKEVLYWVAPMDPNYHSDEPGKSPMGMDLVPVYADADNEVVFEPQRLNAANSGV